MSLLTYLLIGIGVVLVMDLLYEYVFPKLEELPEMTNKDRIGGIFVWPMLLLVFIIGFIVTLIKLRRGD